MMRKVLLLASLVVAGELVFGLAFSVPRFFRPTMLQVFGFSNTLLGDLFAVYGITAMIAYFPGGALADRFPARTLIVTALFATAVGGLYMATIPGAMQMAMLYGYWGVTTIFLFWGALITTTRYWGSDKSQGVAFGLLEGGRGLVAAALATFAVGVLALSFPENVDLVTAEEREAGFKTVILLYTLMTFLAGVFAWFALPAGSVNSSSSPLQGMALVLRRPIVWAQAGVIVCAYCAFRGLDNYSLYADQVLGLNEIAAERLTAYGAWTRPIAALIAGIVADRFNASRSIALLFAVLTVSYAWWALSEPVGLGVTIIYANFFISYFAVFALRGIYFALLVENRTPRFVTGAAVGITSCVGFTPEIFFAPIAGRILDANPGAIGFRNYFIFLAVVSAAGILVTCWLIWLRRHGHEKLWSELAARTK